MTTSTWAELVEEYHADVMGRLWLRLLQDVVASVTQKYPPGIYAETGEWNGHAIENLVQDVAIHQLLEQGQLAYIIDTATTTRVATALLHRLVRRTLGNTRRRTVVDNLLDRCRQLRTFTDPPGPVAEDRHILAAARQVAQIPRLGIRREERAPAIYTTPSLRDILTIAEHHLGHRYSERDLARIFEHVLTSYLPNSLDQSDSPTHDQSPSLTPDQEVVVADVLTQLLGSMSAEQRTIVALKLADRSDTEVARHLQISRPTAAKRFRESTALIQAAVEDLPTRLQDAVLSELPDLLRADLSPATSGQSIDRPQQKHEQ